MKTIIYLIRHSKPEKNKQLKKIMYFKSESITKNMKNNGKIVVEGFEAFRRGTFGNGGQNIYVSKAGVLQRIHQTDITEMAILT